MKHLWGFDMKIIKGIKIGGLQAKIFTLLLVFILGLIGIYTTVFSLHLKNLSKVVMETDKKQEASIKEISENTMENAMDAFLTRSTALQAYIADDLFSEVVANVKILRAVAQEVFANVDAFQPHPFSPPDAANAGKPSVQMQHEEGVDPAKSRDLGLLANMSEIMLAVFESCDKLDSCFVATTDGCILYVDDRADVYINPDGSAAYAPRLSARPWYRQAVEAGDIIFTNVEADTFTGILGLVCAAPIYHDGELVAVVGADIFLDSISSFVRSTATESGFLCVVNRDGQVLFSPRDDGELKAVISATADDLRESSNRKLASFIKQALRERTGVQEADIDGRACYLSGAPLPSVGWTIVSVVDKAAVNQPTESMLNQYNEINEEALSSYSAGASRSSAWVTLISTAVVLLAVLSARRLGSRVVQPLEKLTRHINAQKNGDDVFTVDDSYRTGDEIEILAEAFSTLSERTRKYIAQITQITAEKERIGTELKLAARIQADMLPSTFPPFPERSEFDLYASMDPAKEVGGDFYDFFLIDEDHLGLVIADVSGKGVPAALLMMIAKLLVQNDAMTGRSPAEVLEAVNRQICANNREEMFITVWFGVLEISTGKITAVNAGHEYPAVMQPDGQFTLLKDKHGFVIGGMEEVKYREYELQLSPGSKLFIYTDGVPEATNAENELFGTDRMLEALNTDPLAHPETVLENVRRAVDDFVLDAEQFDDMTMLCLEYRGGKKKS